MQRLFRFLMPQIRESRIAKLSQLRSHLRPRRKIRLAENPKHCYISEIPPREEGRFGRIVTNREAGSGGREWAQTMLSSAYDPAAWSCPLDAGVKLIEIIDRRR